MALSTNIHRCEIRNILLCCLLLVSCGKREEPQQPPSPPMAVAMSPQAVSLFEKFECTRCHDVPNVPAPGPTKQCVGCHQKILHGDYADAAPEVVAKWRVNLHSLPIAPSLVSIGNKLRRDWVKQQLLSPIDQRPALPATMPRLAITESQAEILARALVPLQTVPEGFSKSLIPAGEALWNTFSCATCHQFGSAPRIPMDADTPAESRPSRETLALAPDLLLTRTRFQSGQLVPWLMSPESIAANTSMPNFNFTIHQARAMAAYIWYRTLPAQGQKPWRRLPVLQREVRWDEVFTKVIKTVCWHCHSSKELAHGDGGPGNTGGFGFAAKGLDMSSYESILSGSIGPNGKRNSIFTPNAQGTSLLVRHLLARQQEERGSVSLSIRGMPLGFPALTPDQVQLVETWIAQGRPR